jgi:hypothetical protein
LDRFFGAKRNIVWQRLADEVGDNYFVGKDLTRLKELYRLFGETLHQLCRIVAAIDKDPGIVI